MLVALVELVSEVLVVVDDVVLPLPSFPLSSIPGMFSVGSGSGNDIGSVLMPGIGIMARAPPSSGSLVWLGPLKSRLTD